MGFILTSLALILSIQLETCAGQCNGSVKEISENGTVFQSPHFGCEHRRNASCTWRTKKSRDHVTFMHVIWLQVRTADNVSCKSSHHRLRIRGEKVSDKLFIDDGTSATCYAIPHRKNCVTLRDVGVCKLLKQNPTVTVKYISKGCKKRPTDGLGEDFERAFRIKYETFRCEEINQETVGWISQSKSWSGNTNEISFSPACSPPTFNNPTTERLTNNPTTERPTYSTTERLTNNPTTERPTNYSTTERLTNKPTTERLTNYSTTERRTNNRTTERLPVRHSRSVMFYGLLAGGGFAAFLCVTGLACYFVKRGKRRSSSPEHRQLGVSNRHKSSEIAYDNVAEMQSTTNDYQRTFERRETIVECAYEITNPAGPQYERTVLTETPGYHVPFAKDTPSIEARYEPTLSDEQVRVADVEYEIGPQMAHAHIAQPAYEPMLSNSLVRVPESEYEM